MTPDVSADALDRLRDDHPIRRTGYLILLFVFGGLGGWAALAPLNSAAVAPGTVTVKSYRKTVQHLEGGIVNELHVRDGEHVKQGEPLLTLDATQAKAEQELLLNQKVATEALQARLTAELGNTNQLTIPKAALTHTRASEAWQAEKSIFQSQHQARAGEIQILQQTVAQLAEQISGLQSVIHSKRQLEQSYKDEVNDLRALLKEGFTDKQRLRDQERALARLSAEITDHTSSIAQLQQRSGEAKLKIIQLNKNFTQETTEKLAEAQTKFFDNSERLRVINERLQRSVIRAPTSGIVLGLSVHTVGGVIAAGSPILEIVPENAELIVEVRISPNDIDRVHIGMPADIRFSAFNQAKTPVINGTLDHISADRLYDDASRQSFYLGHVSISSIGHQALGKQTLVPGMPAEVMLNTGSRTLLSYLVQPASNWMARSLNED